MAAAEEEDDEGEEVFRLADDDWDDLCETSGERCGNWFSRKSNSQERFLSSISSGSAESEQYLPFQ